MRIGSESTATLVDIQRQNSGVSTVSKVETKNGVAREDRLMAHEDASTVLMSEVQNVPEVREGRVTELRGKIQADAYEVNPDQIAEAMRRKDGGR